MKENLISVIVPVYNTKKYLPRCVDSLRGQTFSNLEIILVDDGSTDGSGRLCDKFAAEDERIRVYHKENGGSSSARNLGIEKAQGAFLGFVDSDDYVDPEMYGKLHEAINRYQVNAAQIGRDEIDPEGVILPDICVPPEREELIAPEKFMRELLLHRGDCSFCTKLIRRELFSSKERNASMDPMSSRDWQASVGSGAAGESVDDENQLRSGQLTGLKDGASAGNRFPVGVLNEDFHLLIQMLERIGPIVSLPGHAYHVFYRVGSNSRKAEKENFSRVYGDSVDNADMAAEIVAEKYPELAEIAFRFGIFQRLEYMLHIPISQMRRDNDRYLQIVKYLRKNWVRSMKNPVLTKKNKLYHTLFAVAPKWVRQVHRRLRRV